MQQTTTLLHAVVPPLQILSIILAVLLNRKLPGTGVFRTMYYIPVVTSLVAVAITWRWLYQDRGLLNGFLSALGVIHPLEPVGFLTDPNIALWSVMAVTLWKGLGYYMVIYLAGLQSVPAELGEAAEIDGANKLQKLFRVTIPLLRPYVLFCSLLSTIAALRELLDGPGCPGSADGARREASQGRCGLGGVARVSCGAACVRGRSADAVFVLP